MIAVDCVRLAASYSPAVREASDVLRVGVRGISQGGWIAPLAASTSVRVAFGIAASAVRRLGVTRPLGAPPMSPG